MTHGTEVHPLDPAKTHSSLHAPPNEPRRPLLGGGELLRGEGDRRKIRGEKFHPFSVGEAFKALAPLGDALASGIAKVPDGLTARHLVFEATLLPNYIASSYFPAALIAQAGLYTVGTRESAATHRTEKKVREDEPTKTVILAGARQSIESFARAMTRRPLGETDAAWLEMRKFAEVRLPDPNTIVRYLPADAHEDDVITWEAVLTTVGRDSAERQTWGNEAFLKWVAYVRKLDGDVDVGYRREIGGMMFVPIRLRVGAVHDAARFNVLRAVRPMPGVRIAPEDVLRSMNEPAPSPLPAGAKPLFESRVAIFDGGVPAVCPHFSGFVTAHEVTPEAPTQEYLSHGAAVTSAFLYGPLNAATQLATPPAFVDHYRVLPPPSAPRFDERTYWILDRIVEVVRNNSHRYVNLSVGPDRPVEDTGEPDRWTSELDTLAAERGVLFVTAAGNNGHHEALHGLNRVQVPADMVNGIGVGACTARTPTKITRSAFSAMGPGRAGQRVQPLGVSFGGSLEASHFVVLSDGASLSEVCGTSYAAPFALRGFVTLAGQLGARASPEAIRAFGAHFAERGSRGHKHVELGYGRFREDYSKVWECAPNEVTLVYQDRISRGAVTAMRFPFPEGVPSATRIAFEWTLAYQSEIDPSDSADYTLSGFDPIFRPHEGRRTLLDAITREHIDDVEFPRDANRYAMLARSRPVDLGAPKAHSGWKTHRTERQLKDAGKWETLFHGRAALNAAELFRPRLDLNYLARSKGVLVPSEEPIPITLVVTLRASDDVPLYDLVRNQFYVLAPLALQTQVRSMR